MCRLSYEKCICFLFLVILAVLSCSGFRIDNLVMTDLLTNNNKKYYLSHTSTNSLLEKSSLPSTDIEQYFGSSATTAPPQSSSSSSLLNSISKHRLRHQRHLRYHQQTREMKALAAPQPPPSSISTLDQIPSSLATSESAGRHTKLTRSIGKRPNRGKGQKQKYPQYDLAWKVYNSNTVVLAQARSKSLNSSNTYIVDFFVEHVFKKTSFPVDEMFRLKFINSSKYDDERNSSARNHSLVKAQIKPTYKYILFLNTTGAHQFNATFEPLSFNEKTKLFQKIQRFSALKYSNTSLSFEKIQANVSNQNKRVEMSCKIKGRPFPIIHWMHNDKRISPSKKFRIRQKNDGKGRRLSTLVIKTRENSDFGSYWCTARGVDGKLVESETYNMTRPVISSMSQNEPCSNDLKKEYCQNGGTCRYEPSLKEPYCNCADGFSGKQCESKTSNAAKK